MATISELNNKQDSIEQAIRQAEKNLSNAEDEMEHWAVRITSAETDRQYGAKFAAAKKRWMIAKKKLTAQRKKSNVNIRAIHRLHKQGRTSNPIKKFNIKTASGKAFQILATSEQAAVKQVKAMFGGGTTIVRNPTFRVTGYRGFTKTVKAKDKQDARLKAISLGLKSHGIPRATRIGNPLEKGSWIPAHAVRIRRGKLEILRDK